MFRVIVKKVRANNYASVSILNARGSVVPQDYSVSVRFPDSLYECVSEGSVWDVDGAWKFRTFKAPSGKEVSEKQYSLSVAELISPVGQSLALWIEKNIDGIGVATAFKLTRGIKDLNAVVLAGDIDTLVKIDGVSELMAHKLIMGWPDPEIYDAIRFLSECGLPPKLADPITKIYGRSTEGLIKQDPYLLVPMGVSFANVEALINKLKIEVSQEATESALAEDIAHSISINGSTVVTLKTIKSKAKALGYAPSDQIADYAVNMGTLIQVENGYQTVGMARMEAIVGHAIAGFLDRPRGKGALCAGWETDITRASVLARLSRYEQTELGFELTAEQRAAVTGSVTSTVSCISGGAGVGKTTILKAILGVYEAFDHQGMVINLMALSGRAAMRMNQSTGNPAITIAKFIYDNSSKNRRNPVDQCLIVIDEASMVDLHSMYRLVALLPDVTRIIFVGDTAQLPPVGGGLVFHEIVKTRVPTYHLTAVKRQSEDSGIHALATQIREGKHRDMKLDGYDDIEHHKEPSLKMIERIWRAEGGAKKAIILCPTNTSEFGVDAINAYIQKSVGLERDLLHFMDKDGSIIPWRVKGRHLHLGDQLMVTQNDYACGIRNGDLATITQVYSEFEQGKDGYIYGTMNLDGDVIEITNRVIEKLDLGYAVTIHKSQGSQWHSVIVVLSEASRHMTDRSLLYTAVTRPQKRLILLGDRTLMEMAVSAGNIAGRRRVGLREVIDNVSRITSEGREENLVALIE